MENKRFSIFNGQLVNADDPLFSAKNRAFRYGDALFETIRIVNGQPLFTDLHVVRLKTGMDFLSMEIPECMATLWLKNTVNRLCAANGINRGGRARLTVFRNDGGLYTPDSNSVSYLVEAEPLIENQYTFPHEKGLIVGVYPVMSKPITPLSNLKSTNCLLYTMAGIYARQHGFDESLIKNEKGNIVESASSNIFVVKDNIVKTPPLSEGCLGGIMRLKVLDLVKNADYEPQESEITEDELPECDEIFLTNVIAGIKWVVGFKEKRYYAKVSKMLVELLSHTN